MRRVLILATALLLSPPVFSDDTEPRLLLGPDYPIEVRVSYHVGLLHWLDSLTHLEGAGYTAGKTKEAHRDAFLRHSGTPTKGDRHWMKRYHAARMVYVRNAEPDERDRLTLAFLGAPDLDAALTEAQELLDEQFGKEFAQAVRHFEPVYGKIWRGGLIPLTFLHRTEDSEQRQALARFLLRVAAFFGIDSEKHKPPTLYLVPVPAGYGTHAQAIGPYLLVEVRKGESLADEVAPIVHENVHYLFYGQPESKLSSLESAALERGDDGEKAWFLLKEALPTAIAQGVADERFRGAGWSAERPWYHLPPVDEYAKRIFPLVKQALDDGSSFDEAFVRKLVAAY